MVELEEIETETTPVRGSQGAGAGETAGEKGTTHAFSGTPSHNPTSSTSSHDSRASVHPEVTGRGGTKTESCGAPDKSADGSASDRDGSSAEAPQLRAETSEPCFHDAQEHGVSDSVLEGGDPKTLSDCSGDDVVDAQAQEGSSGDKVAAEDEVFQDSLTEEDLRKAAIAESEGLKVKGNKAYGEKEYVTAMQHYAAALEACPVHEDSLELRAACHANRAMCLLCLEEYGEAVRACTEALELKPDYVKALMRRAQAHEKMDKLEEALADAKKVLELDSSNQIARATVKKLGPVVEERREKLKEEMLGKLKDLGNSLLGHFGMSLDNFKAVQDPETGSYSINFQN